jgi:hypothetical protein
MICRVPGLHDAFSLSAYPSVIFWPCRYSKKRTERGDTCVPARSRPHPRLLLGYPIMHSLVRDIDMFAPMSVAGTNQLHGHDRRFGRTDAVSSCYCAPLTPSRASQAVPWNSCSLYGKDWKERQLRNVCYYLTTCSSSFRAASVRGPSKQ